MSRAARWAIPAGLLMAVAYPAAMILAIRAGSLFDLAFTGAFLVYAVVGLLIMRHRPSNAIGRLFVALALAVPAGVAASGYAQLRLPGAEWAAWASVISFPIIFGGLLIFLPLLFPTGSFLSSGWRRFGRLSAVLLATLGVAFALRPGELDCCPGLENPIAVPAPELLAVIAERGFGVVALSSVVAFASLVVRFRRSRGEQRLQLKWFTVAVGWICLTALAGAGNAIGITPDSELAPLIAYPSGIAAIGLAVGIAILRHRLYDIDLVINRALVYGALTMTLATTYVATVLALQALLGTVTEGNALAVAASTLAVAALVRPMRRRIQAAVDRRFYRSRYDAARTLEAFGAKLRGQVDLASLTQELGSVVDLVMQPRSVSIWVRDER